MAKKNKPKRDPREMRYTPKAKPTQEELPHFYTQDGRRINIKAISLPDVQEAENNIRAEYAERVKIPTYQQTTAGGTVKEYELNEKILDVEDNPAETERRHAVWQAYLKNVEEMEKEISKTTIELIFEGINETPADDGWIARRKRLHLTLPPKDADESEILALWKTSELLKNNIEDIRTGQQEIIVLSMAGMATRGDIEASLDTFPNPLQGTSDIEADSPSGTAENTGEEKDTA